MNRGVTLSAAEAAIYESLVVPRYIQVFGNPAVQMLIPSQGAALAQLGCRTGYPARSVAEHMPGATITGVDPSFAALELARTKAAMLSGTSTEYVHGETLPSPLAAGLFSHSLSLHPLAERGNYTAFFAEHFRVLTPGGQMVVSLPLRGSFPEIYDMLREFAVRHDQNHVSEAVDVATGLRPNPESLTDQVEMAGFVDVNLAFELVAITFENGRDFVEDPISRLVVSPDIRASLPVEAGLDNAMRYVDQAIAQYWSEIAFELTVNIATVSARKPT